MSFSLATIPGAMRMCSKKSAALLLLLILLLFSGCTVKKNGISGVADDTYFGLRDAEGRAMTLAAPPRRIVSLSMRGDDVLFALLGTERIAAFSRFAGNPLISNLPPEATEAVPTRAQATLEYLMKLQPDLIVLSESQSPGLVRALREMGTPVFVSRTIHQVEESKKLIRDLAAIVGEVEKGEALVAEMERRLSIIAAKTAKIPQSERVVVYRLTMSGGAGGKGTAYDDCCRLAGVVNGAAEANIQGNQTLPKEQIVKINPDVIFLPDWDWRGGDVEAYIEECLSDPALQTVKAIQSKRLRPIPDKHMLSSSQHIVACVEDIYRACYEE